MSDATAVGPEALARLPTRIPGLDAVLRGGWPPGGVYLVQGLPGTANCAKPPFACQ